MLEVQSTMSKQINLFITIDLSVVNNAIYHDLLMQRYPGIVLSAKEKFENAHK